MKGLVIDTKRLGRIIEAPSTASSERTINAAGEKIAITIVSEEVIASTREQYPSCRCEELGLEAGMRTSELVEIEAGCTSMHGRARLNGTRVTHSDPPGWVCERLNKVRRTYGL